MEVQIHQQEGKVVKGIDGGQCLVELDGVIERRLPMVENNVCQVEIAVAAADEPVRCTRFEDSGGTFDLTSSAPSGRLIVLRRIGSREARADRSVEITIGANTGRVRSVCVLVRSIDGIGQLHCKLAIELVALHAC